MSDRISELEGQIAVLEVVNVVTLGLYLANTKNDPNFERARALLDFIRDFALKKTAEDLPSPEARQAAARYTDSLLSQVLESVPHLRGSNGG